MFISKHEIDSCHKGLICRAGPHIILRAQKHSLERCFNIFIIIFRQNKAQKLTVNQLLIMLQAAVYLPLPDVQTQK